MLNQLLHYLQKPPAYYPSTDAFWDDPYISGQMLKNHLDPECEGASRNHAFIDQSVEWMTSVITPSAPKILDLGCGPGLYASRLAQKGCRVTGIDFSRRSIAHASEHAPENANYIYQNYLDIEYSGEFDAVILIYCDYAVLPPADRKRLIQKIDHALVDGGKLILDVFTPANYQNKADSTWWETFEQGGFWNPGAHVCLNGFYRYEGNVMLDQSIVITEQDVQAYYLWNTAFTQEQLNAEFTHTSLNNPRFYADATGTPWDETSKTLCAVYTKERSL